MAEITGWLLDLYADPQGGLALWLLGEDGQRYRLCQDFPVTFYAAGPVERLRSMWHFLQAQPLEISLERSERRDLFLPQPVPVLAVQVAHPADQPRLFFRAAAAFPDLTYYDADLPLATRHAAVYGTFPLARCRVVYDDLDNRIQSLSVLDSPWDLDPPAAPVRILSIEPDADPAHTTPQNIHLRAGRNSYRLSLEPARPLLVNLRAILERHDPDLLLTTWGDTWLLPYLLSLAHSLSLPLPLSRDANMGVVRRPERSYFSYGQVIHRGRQVHLFGRWHIDSYNAMLFHDYELDGVLELARVTGQPVQVAARVSPGSGISMMQMTTALRQKILVPWHKQEGEHPKTALELVHADQGGLVYQPLPGLHTGVAEIDFVSMYPGIMVRFNISPETIADWNSAAETVPELGLVVDLDHPGLIPQTLAPLLRKRLAYKTQLASLARWDPRRKRYKACACAHKWLLVTCFGYLGYKNARFGRIEAHQAVTAYGREALLRAKESAEDLGFTVLHMYVDSLFVKKDGLSRAEELQPLVAEIIDRTGLPITLEGVYRWVAFLPSRVDSRLSVANRYFGVFQDGTLKVRGIAACRRDTPEFIAAVQTEILEGLAAIPDAANLPARLPEVIRLLRRHLSELRRRRVPLERLVIHQKLSRALEEYRSPSAAARAAAQLAAIGKHLRPGQRVRFLYTLGDPGVYAWDLPSPADPAALDVPRYTTLLLRAASEILQPFGLSEKDLHDWVIAGAAVSRQPVLLPRVYFPSPPFSSPERRLLVT